jgi:predicted kinase
VLTLLQMSGAPGAGKSTIAAEISRHHGFVVLDYDLVKSTLLDSGTQFTDAGRIAYKLVLALAEDMLGHGSSVVIDSPCFYAELLSAGQSIARRHHATYLYVECVLDDIDGLDARLSRRTPLRSQRQTVSRGPVDHDIPLDADGRELFRSWIDGMKRPSDNLLVIDTSRDLSVCLSDLDSFLQQKGITA